MIRFIQLGIRSYIKPFSHPTAGIFIHILFCSGILINMTYAQVSLKPNPSVIYNSNTTTSQSQQQPHEVKITSPTKGQHAIFGSSKNNLDGVTDTSGEASYSWTVGHNDAIGKYKVDVQVSASGYDNHTASKSFKVNSIPVSTSNSNTDNSNNSVQPNSGNSDTNNDNDNTANHNQPLSIISIPHIRIPEIRFPFYLPFH